jgi:hypothetical protein
MIEINQLLLTTAQPRVRSTSSLDPDMRRTTNFSCLAALSVVI